MSASYLETGPLKVPFSPGDIIADKYEVVVCWARAASPT